MNVDAAALPIEFDDIIYALQNHGGITQYWQEITRGIARRPGFSVSRCATPAWHRLLRTRSSARVFHSSYFRIARGRHVRNVVTIHDMAFELGHVGNDLRARLARLERRLAYFAADALICVSESTRRDLLTLFPALAGRCPISVIHHGPTLAADLPGRPLAALLPDPAVPFVLFVGGRKHYKNFDGAVRAFALPAPASACGERLNCWIRPPAKSERTEFK